MDIMSRDLKLIVHCISVSTVRNEMFQGQTIFRMPVGRFGRTLRITDSQDVDRFHVVGQIKFRFDDSWIKMADPDGSEAQFRCLKHHVGGCDACIDVGDILSIVRAFP